MALGADALAVESRTIFKGVEGVARTVPIDDRKTDGFDDLGTEVEENRATARGRAMADRVIRLS
ncbi:hypothetical protein [Agrobacterium sp. TS43]|uniref:hypothetical protein n=1 Tax=Agrobacterium sp. TS43 TaxID=477196 RepID=UPI000A8B2CDC|nr:hypothetical protein [Agrobacterium sp. TS43]